MKQVSTAELVRNIGDVTHAAIQAPVIVTHHKKPRFVFMNIETYEALRALDPRRAYRVEETPDDVAEWLLPGLEKMASGDFDYDD